MKLIAKLIYIILTIVETTIAIRIVLKLLNIPAGNQFTTIIYKYSDLFLKPLAGIGAPIYFDQLLIDVNAVIGLFAYMIVMFIVVEIIKALSL